MLKTVMCIIYREINHQYEFLVFKRKKSKGDFYQFLVGVVEKNESYKHAVIRESFEEASISLDDIIKINPVFNRQIIHQKHPVKEYSIAMKVNSSVKIDISHNPDKEHNFYQWCSYKQAMDLLKWKENKDSLKLFFKRYICR